MTSKEIRQKYLDFFVSKKHVLIPSSSLLPDGDATTLFTGSGMQPMIKYLLGEPHPSGSRITDSQKCFRAEDIDEVGDNRHTTFFEMLGNWSLGDYFKQEQLAWIFEFLVDVVGLDPKKLYVSVFTGDEKYGIPKDEEAVGIWQKLFKSKGIDAKVNERIFYYPAKKNWWSRSGPPEKMPAREPGGPDSEIFYEFTDVIHRPEFGATCHPNCDCGRFMEIGNNVFMAYRKTEANTFEKLPKQNIDFGGGLERITAASNNNADMFAIDTLSSLITALPASNSIRSRRIVADHVRSAAFLIQDGVLPSNKDRGYMLRKLLRRAIVHGATEDMFAVVCRMYEGVYELNQATIIAVFADEAKRFKTTLKNGMKELDLHQNIDATIAFKLYESFGLPYEVIKEFAGDKAKALTREDFEKKLDEHREISRAGAEKKFGGHGLLLDTGEIKAKDEVELKKVTRLHTATHLLQAALREVLGHDVKQAGSDITVERTRFDFTFSRKLTQEEIKKVEAVVNREIENNLPVTCKEMPKDEAIKTGALYFFKAKYGDRVKVYCMGHDMESAFSKEFCGGPHVEHTGVVGKFRIAKEEAVSSGVRRIRGVILP